jgi:hypothetical protein
VVTLVALREQTLELVVKALMYHHQVAQAVQRVVQELL